MASKESRDTGIHIKMKAEAAVRQPNPRHTRGSWQPPGGRGRMGRIG